MGLAYARVTLANPRLRDLAPVEVDVRTDTGSSICASPSTSPCSWSWKSSTGVK
jgi:hypothetical protein